MPIIVGYFSPFPGCCEITEAVVQRCSVKNVHIENLKKQIYLRALGLQLYQKKARVFSCQFSEISKKNFFTKHHRTTASIKTNSTERFDTVPKL